jgi:hypothetical protein
VEDAVAQDAGVVHQNVDAAERVDRGLDDASAFCGSVIESVEAMALPPACLDVLDGLLRGP